MRKLSSLKSWFDTYEAARLLTDALEESVSTQDIFRLALDSHLTLSVRFINPAYGRKCTQVNPSDISWKEVPALIGDGVIKLPMTGKVLFLDENTYHVDGDVVHLEGNFDLPMIGGERIDVEFAYHTLQLQPTPTAVSLDGVLVRSVDGTLYELQSRYEYPKLEGGFNAAAKFHPAGALPEDRVFVLRKECLDAFINEHSTIPKETVKPLGAREHKSYLNIIGAMLELLQNPRAGRVDDAAIVRELVQNYGDKYGISESNLNRKFPEAKRSLRAD